MPSFNNLTRFDDQTRRASHEAGVAIIRAIREAFFGLEAYEFLVAPQPDLAIARFRSAAAMFERTAYLYGRLAEIAPDRPLDVSEDVLATFDSAFGFHRRFGGILLRESLGNGQLKSLTTTPISSRFVIEFARSVSGDVGRGLSEVPLEPTDAEAAHRVASDITVVQMLGLAATKALDRLT
jgi:hypothetical protein